MRSVLQRPAYCEGVLRYEGVSVVRGCVEVPRKQERLRWHKAGERIEGQPQLTTIIRQRR